MQYREVTFTFPEEATDRDKVILILQSPYSFVRWCRTRVGRAPNAIYNCDDGCVVEEYLRYTTGVYTTVGNDCVNSQEFPDRYIVSPMWVMRVLQLVDRDNTRATYNDVANMLMLALEGGEIA